jgi:outer membrane protein assembly factor BamB
MTVFVGMQYLEVTDLEKDGRPEIIFVAGMDPKSLGSTMWQWWLKVYSADSGEVRWQQPLSVLGNFSGQFAGDFRIQTELSDLNRDGVLDLIFPIVTTTNAVAIRAFNGNDGSPLWTHSLSTRMISFRDTDYLPVVRVAEVNADSQPAVIIGDLRLDRCEIVALNANNATVLWATPISGLEKKFINGSLAVAKNDPDEPQSIGLLISYHDTQNAPSTEFVLVDQLGKIRQRRTVKPLTDDSASSGGLQCWDVNRDGAQEWVFIDDGKLIAASPDFEKTIWQWKIPDEVGDVVDVRFEHPSPTIAVHFRGTNYASKVYLIDERTGQTLQQYDGKNAELSFLQFSKQDQPPMLVMSDELATICRRAIPTEQLASVEKSAHLASSLRKLSPSIADRTSDRTIQINSDSSDPRFTRRLPWAHMRHGVLEVILSMVICVVALILPGSIVISAVRKRRWSLRRLLAGPVIVAVVIVLFRSLGSESVDLAAYTNGFSGPFMMGWRPTTEVLRSPFWLFVLGLQGFPFIFFFASVAAAAQRWQWRWLAFQVATFGCFLAVMTGAMLIYDFGQMDPRERYSWRDVWWCLYPPAFMAGMIGLLARFVGFIRRVAPRFISSSKSGRPRTAE